MAGPNAPPATPLEACLARQGPANARAQLPHDSWSALESAGSTSVRAAVVVGDLRMSGLLVREAVSAALFARYLVGFTEAVRGLATGFDGWFDKFTGDGFIAFWIYHDEDQVVETVPAFCQAIRPASDSLVNSLKRNSRNFPTGVGLSIGVDAGPCELVRVGDSLTLIGSPIVGATRMVAGARAGQTLLNVGIGSTFEERSERLEAVGGRVARRVVTTKEYPEGQEAFELEFAGRPARERTPEAATA
jgi:class 3 adenylate cyclase